MLSIENVFVNTHASITEFATHYYLQFTKKELVTTHASAVPTLNAISYVNVVNISISDHQPFDLN